MSQILVKLAHYLKIPSRTLFFAQGLATILGALTQVGTTLWMLSNIKGVCTDDQPNGFSCPNGETVYSSSIIWGLIGPGRLYSVGKIYSGLVGYDITREYDAFVLMGSPAQLHFFWIGLIAPPITYYIWKKTKIDWVKKINWPLILYVPPSCP